MSGRRIEARTRGQQHGFIRRMVSTGGAISERIKPFVFLDFIDAPVAAGTGFGWHPHSGIATLTYALDADLACEDTAGQQGIVQATGLEWRRAGGGWGHLAPGPHPSPRPQGDGVSTVAGVASRTGARPG